MDQALLFRHQQVIQSALRKLQIISAPVRNVVAQVLKTWTAQPMLLVVLTMTEYAHRRFLHIKLGVLI